MQHYWWRASELQTARIKVESSKVVELTQLQHARIGSLKSLLLKDQHLAEKVFRRVTCNSDQQYFDWADFATSITVWEDYVSQLHKELLISLPDWKAQQSMFRISFDVK